MVTNNAVNLNASGICGYDGAGSFNGNAVTNHSIILGGANNHTLTNLGVATNGQLPIGSAGADPVLATLTAGTGVSITNGAGSITINATGGGLTWTDVTGTSASMAVNNGYLADNVGLVTLTLPATAVQFSVIAVAGKGAGGWKIAQNAGQQIQFGSVASTSGATGFLASTNQFDCVYLLATVGGASTVWQVLNSVGNITVS
jgi:hypothetical protein